jgi:hypothetical protein
MRGCCGEREEGGGGGDLMSMGLVEPELRRVRREPEQLGMKPEQTRR